MDVKVRAYFPELDEWHNGVVQAHRARSPSALGEPALHRVLYADGDCEDVDDEELHCMRVNYERYIEVIMLLHSLTCFSST